MFIKNTVDLKLTKIWEYCLKKYCFYTNNKKKSLINKILTFITDFGIRFAFIYTKQNSPLILFSLWLILS